jgi:nitrate reductase gamma subunit
VPDFYNVIFGHFNVLDTVAPWIRGIVTFTPDAMLMKAVPVSYKIHVIAAWALLGFRPSAAWFTSGACR